MNAMAGGGTILTYPALLFAGESAITANATSTVALWPGAATSMFGYRHEVRPNAAWLRVLFLPSLLGGAVGAVLLLRTPVRVFEGMAPFLILFATALFMIQGLLSRRAGADPPAGRKGPGRAAAAWLFQLGIGIYGGYFGAGLSVIVLAALGITLEDSLTRLNALKQLIGFGTNVAAAVFFLFSGHVVWPAALVMAAGALVGGALGGRLAGRIKPSTLRWIVVSIGVIVSLVFFVRS